MQQCDELTRVGYLLEGIQCSVPGLQAAMASVQMDDGVNGMRSDIKKAAAHLLSYDPIARKQTGGTK